ncbi:SCP2 sterol transfer family protein [Capsaspora owczarzaki ATCC 30864]|uniref:Hydroxysteroid dehydrogenase-like protein 2 n=1 Tax=Capsaspora owczarzaki (strain ATCC 30864) TaxID=595528 RepID=A0A0D2WV61_CAPO3|nr:SCP2 sterol transfer family protein [Capsaspora owczarzaki ATCC 30864]KJE96013.1 SCP2 sterol transfer family protein [Capsaspora owczarzaki ATCC 30864]|eukprot:XP_004345137.1 SCP2 sterol transfer family protein [Capsaspora owczarzaki ATCC 30864]
MSAIANTGALKGVTIFITGASRGIGKAIALKAARDGANIVIAAKTTVPHPKLPGTIYTAAEEIVAAGGQALPCAVDLRNDDQLNEAVKQAVAKFGGIDILVNNASAISLTGTAETPLKKFDLMNGVNARGTYSASQACLPYLKKSKNPHILNISPPLNMRPKWFKNHVAYTMAKYGMSMCVLGMSEEFHDDGIAVNALWPQTAISTAAMDMLAGGEADKVCRNTHIMSDAAYVILTQNSRQASNTGNFYIDEAVLQRAGIKNFDQYACVPGSKLMPDFFLEDHDNAAAHESLSQIGGRTPSIEANARASLHSEKAAATAAAPAAAAAAPASKLDKIFVGVRPALSSAIVEKTKATFQFQVAQNDGSTGLYYIDLKTGSGASDKGEIANPDVTMILSEDTLVKLFAREIKPTAAFFAGKLKIKGDMTKAIRLETLMTTAKL